MKFMDMHVCKYAEPWNALTLKWMGYNDKTAQAMALSVHSIIIPIILIHPAGTCKFKAIYYASFITDADTGDGCKAK